MNKNLVILALLVLVVFMGVYIFRDKLGIQTASVIKTQADLPSAEGIRSADEFKDFLRVNSIPLYIPTEEQMKNLQNAYTEINPNGLLIGGTTGNRPFSCWYGSTYMGEINSNNPNTSFYWASNGNVFCHLSVFVS